MIPNVLCDICHKRKATIFVTKVQNNQSAKQHLCETCARARASGDSWLQLMDETKALDKATLDEIVVSLFQQSGEQSSGDFEKSGDQLSSALSSLINFSEFAVDSGDSPDEIIIQELPEGEELESESIELYMTPQGTLTHDEYDEAAAASPSRELVSKRCGKCGTTWDRLRQDGRVGCSQCYVMFQEQLNDVMSRLQGAAQHTGKTPRAAQKRRRRLETLRARRDHRLDMLNRRLQEAVAQERYEDAAKLRDQIKMVASTIVSSET